MRTPYRPIPAAAGVPAPVPVRALLLAAAVGFALPGCKSDRTEETPPAASAAPAQKEAEAEPSRPAGDPKLSQEDRQALAELEKAIDGLDRNDAAKEKEKETDLLKGVLGQDSALKVPEMRESGAPPVYGASIPPGLLPFDARKALAYLDQLISFRLDLKVADERINKERRVVLDISSSIWRTATGDFAFDQQIIQTPTGSAPSHASLKAVRTPVANFLKISEAPWWRYAPNQSVRLERYLDLRLVEKVLQNSAQLGELKVSPVTYQGRSATRYRLDKKPGVIPPAFSTFNPKTLDMTSEITVDGATGLMLKLDYALSSRYDPGQGDTAETVSVRLAVSEIGGVPEIVPPENFVEGPALGGGNPERPR